MNDIIWGLIFLGCIAIALSLYAAWNVKIRHRPTRRAAKEDSRLVDTGEITKGEFSLRIKEMVPSLITANAILAAITVSVVFLIVARILFGNDQPYLEEIKQWTVFAVLAMAAVASICWLFIIEQLTQIISPSADIDRIIRFHRYNYDLWFGGLVLLITALYLFLLLVNLYVAIITGFAMFWIIIGYWKIHNGWKP